MPRRLKSSSLGDVPMTAKAREFYENEFLPQCQRLFNEISQTPLSILIWGPGPDGSDIYDKRLQIRDYLRRRGHAASFSEEINIETSAGASASARILELCQAVCADFIIVIQSSPGSIAEVHDVGEFPKVGSKMLIFIDLRARDGYSYTGLLAELKTLYNNVETYSYPKDIQECFLLGAVERKVQALQAAKWKASLR